MREEVRIFLMSGLLEEYAMGLTSPEQNVDIERYLEEYEEVREAYEKVQQEFEQYAREKAVQPPAELRDKIIGQSVVSSGSSNWMPWVVAAGFALMLFGMFVLYQEWQTELRQNEQISQKFQELQASCARLQEESELMALIQHEHTQSWKLVGNEKVPTLKLMAYWNPTARDGRLMIQNLPIPPKGHCFQVWADVKGEMIPVGFAEHNKQWVKLKYLENIESLNLTIEQEGGAEHPNVDQLVAATKAVFI